MTAHFEDIKEYVNKRKRITKLELNTFGMHPHFVIIQVGNNEASNRYVRNKIKDCTEVGIKTTLYKFDEEIKEEIVIETIKSLNKDNSVDAFMVQFPLPEHIDKKKIISLIDPKKDADGFTNNGITNPATPQGIITYLERQGYNFENKNALVVGRSEIVGKPMARLLLEKNCNVTVVHSHTSVMRRNDYLLGADLIVCATGQVNIITENDFPGFLGSRAEKVVFDVGINFDENGKLVGDCEKNLPVGWQSPVPGGVGLLTRLQLLENIVKLYELRHEEEF